MKINKFQSQSSVNYFLLLWLNYIIWNLLPTIFNNTRCHRWGFPLRLSAVKHGSQHSNWDLEEVEDFPKNHPSWKKHWSYQFQFHDLPQLIEKPGLWLSQRSPSQHCNISPLLDLLYKLAHWAVPCLTWSACIPRSLLEYRCIPMCFFFFVVICPEFPLSIEKENSYEGCLCKLCFNVKGLNFIRKKWLALKEFGSLKAGMIIIKEIDFCKGGQLKFASKWFLVSYLQYIQVGLWCHFLSNTTALLDCNPPALTPKVAILCYTANIVCGNSVYFVVCLCSYAWYPISF